MVQLQSATSVAQALAVMVEATSLSSAVASKLTALLQNSQDSEDESLGAPAAQAYKNKSGGIIETMQDLYEKGEAAAQGDLDVTSKDLAEDVKDLATLHQDCMKGAEDFEAETKSRGEELKALATAKNIIVKATS